MANAKRCLLIEDDHDDQLVFSVILDKLDKSILCVSVNNGSEAIKKLEEDLPVTPDLIFLDLNLPGLNGMDCLTWIKANPELRMIPVVIYTTSSRNEDVVKAKNLGAVAFITKSYHIRDLMRKLDAFF
jgi:CheY-like chemotaxis protein